MNNLSLRKAIAPELSNAHWEGCEVAFQPVVRAGGSALEIVAFESFLRVGSPWCGQTLAHLIATAEEDHSIVEVDTWVFNQVCKVVVADPSLHVWVNTSQISMSNTAFVGAIIDAATRLGITNRLTLEMTESADGEINALRRNIQKLHAQSVAVVLDDIHDGFAKRALLDSYAVAGCKLSRNTTVQMTKDSTTRKAVEDLSLWCRRAGKTLVIEGIETRTELGMAIDCGIELCQGFLFSPPTRLDTLPVIGGTLSVP